MAELLLEKGADPDLQDYKGETALMKLMEQDLEDENVSDLIHLLLEAGADLNTITNNEGLTALDILHQQGGSEDVLGL
jgi:ankyrin repeat protein